MNTQHIQEDKSTIKSNEEDRKAKKMLSDDEIEKQARERVMSEYSKPKPLTAKEKRITKSITAELRKLGQVYKEREIDREIIREICKKINEKNISKCMNCKLKQIAEKRTPKK